MENKRLYIFTLGGLSLTHEGEPVSALVSKKAEALLVYLTCEGREISRDILAELLWEERTQERAMGNLRVALASLRKELGEFVTITRDTAAINRDASIWLDVDHFEELINSGEMEKAVEIYRGDFLEGFYLRGAREFENWIVIEREQLERKYRDGLDSLVDSALETGDYPSGIGYASLLLSDDPTREAAHRKLMKLLFYNGQRGEALEQYQECWRVLGEEQGLEPSKETRQLYQDILDEKIVIPEPERKLAPKLKKPKFLEKYAQDRRPPPLFFAKERQLKKLKQHLQAALEGEGKVIFVCGGPGRGKTALVDEFAKRAMLEYPELLVAKGSCNAYTGIGDPYLPFREVLSMLSGDVETLWKAGAITTDHTRCLWKSIPLVVQALLERGPNLLETFIPGKALFERSEAAAPERSDLLEALTREVDRPKRTSEGLEQSHLFEQFTNVLRLVAEEHPLLLILDDLQWADTASISLLFHLGRRITANKILIIGAYRPEEVALGREGDRHPLEKTLTEFTLLFGDVKVDLAEEGEDEGIQFIKALLDSEPNLLDESFRQALFTHTSGHPLFTIELLRSLQERGELLVDEDGCWIAGPAMDWKSLPARVEAVIAERIARLEDDLREILTVASVEGEDFTAQVVARIQEVEERRLLRLLSNELEKRHRLIRARSGLALDHKMLARYRFAHHLFQQYLYNELSEEEKQLLHGEIARVLEGLYAQHGEEMSGSNLFQLGWHYTQAGEVDKAVEYLILGGDQAHAAGAHQEALRHYEKANEVIPYQDSELRAQLSFKLGETLARLGEYTNAFQYLEEAQELAQMIDNHELEIKALYRTAFYKYGQGFDEQASDIIQQALEISEASGNQRGKMLSMKMMGILEYEKGNLKYSDRLYEKSLVLARELGEWSETAACLNNLGLNAMYRGDLAVAMRFIKESIEINKDFNDLWNHSVPLYNYGRCLCLRGNYQEARLYLEESFSIVEQIGDPWGIILFITDLGYLNLLWGHYNTTRTLLEEGHRIAQECEVKSYEAYNKYYFGHFLIATGDFEGAQNAFGIANNFYQNNKRIFEIGECLYGLGLTAIWSGQYKQALEKFNAALEITRKVHKHLNTQVMRGIGEIHHKQGDDKIARKYYQDSLSMATEFGYPIEKAYCHARLGQIHSESKEFETAEYHYTQALKISTEIELRPATVETLVYLARMQNQLNQSFKAATVSAWASEQERCTQATREEAGKLLDELKERMEAQEFEKVKKIGKSMDLEQVLGVVELALNG